MSEEQKNKEEQRDAGLVNAALAGFDGHTAAGSVSAAGSTTARATDEPVVPLLSSDETKDFRARWDAIPVGFVDEPRSVVEQTDSLVAGAIKRMAEIFADERTKLEGQWDRGSSASTATEDLRFVLRSYRSFLGRLLSVWPCKSTPGNPGERAHGVFPAQPQRGYGVTVKES